ncbi:MAG TPA: hypothetical protein VFF45_00775 [Bacilli bacterium]|jgi:hypothetical protein|nr:hypothetical protein [Bacilli bacterium]
MSRPATALRPVPPLDVPDVEHVQADAAPPSTCQEPSPARARLSLPDPAPSLAAALVEALDEPRRTATLRLGRQAIEAALDPAVDVSVVRTAIARGERVIVQRDAEGWVLVGALRTAATPGVDEGEDFQIKARRIAVHAEHELSFSSGAASLVLRALGQVETLAASITTRASGVHRIIGRMIRLN